MQIYTENLKLAVKPHTVLNPVRRIVPACNRSGIWPNAAGPSFVSGFELVSDMQFTSLRHCGAHSPRRSASPAAGGGRLLVRRAFTIAPTAAARGERGLSAFHVAIEAGNQSVHSARFGRPTLQSGIITIRSFSAGGVARAVAYCVHFMSVLELLVTLSREIPARSFGSAFFFRWSANRDRKARNRSIKAMPHSIAAIAHAAGRRLQGDSARCPHRALKQTALSAIHVELRTADSELVSPTFD